MLQKTFFQSLNRTTAPKVLLIDGGSGHLKLAKWRLHSDGYKIFYARDCIAGMEIFQKELPPVVLLSLCQTGQEGLKTLEKLLNINPQTSIVVVLAKNSREIATMARKRGARDSIYKPFDFQELSRVVQECFEAVSAVEANGGTVTDTDTDTVSAVINTDLNTATNAVIEAPAQSSPQAEVEKQETARLKGKVARRPGNTLALLKNMVSSLSCGLLLLDAGGKVLLLNEAMSVLGGWSYEDCRGKRYSSLPKVQNNLAENCVEALRELIEKGKPEVYLEIPCSDTSTPYDWHVLKASRLIGPRGETTGYFVAVDRLKDFHEFFLQSEKLASVGQLAAGAAHEIRNPLTSVRGFIQLLQNELAGTSKEEYLDIIIAEIDRVNTIVNDFLNLAKPAAPKRQPSNMAELIRDITMLLESEAFIRQIDVKTKLEETPPVSIDKEQLKQVLINIMQNAFEAMDIGGKLKITLKNLKNKKAQISIEDNGAGMDKKTLARIFDPFYTTKETGTGLGLAVAHQIIESHDGTLAVHSQPGKGTTVTIELGFLPAS